MSKKIKRVGGRFNTVTSCISTTMVLILLGIVVFFTVVAHNFSRSVRENFVVEVLVNDNTPNAELLKLQDELRHAPYARRVAYLSKERGTREMAEALEGGPAEFQGFNPIPAEFEVFLKADYATQDSISAFEPVLRQNPYVLDVVYPRDAIAGINDLLPVVGLVLVGLAALLIIISFALINNTMRMSVYARRYTIQTMKLVGAKWSFIRRPFLGRALAIGLVAALVAGGVLGAGILFLMRLDSLISTLITPFVISLTLGSVFGFGLLLTLGCAFFSVNRFLRMKASEVAVK